MVVHFWLIFAKDPTLTSVEWRIDLVRMESRSRLTRACPSRSLRSAGMGGVEVPNHSGAARRRRQRQVGRRWLGE
ncbi:hypothetical protein TIFTF001_018576 [Ficus carica]|uniref:Uncharacterized protein n=1 Tax=Ficus carica TaxID=3494 RepID=A0AA88AVM9_FICCA|nr:hypothetical protein TIFTF001_018576 [Ficus carica]